MNVQGLAKRIPLVLSAIPWLATHILHGAPRLKVVKKVGSSSRVQQALPLFHELFTHNYPSPSGSLTQLSLIAMEKIRGASSTEKWAIYTIVKCHKLPVKSPFLVVESPFRWLTRPLKMWCREHPPRRGGEKMVAVQPLSPSCMENREETMGNFQSFTTHLGCDCWWWLNHISCLPHYSFEWAI